MKNNKLTLLISTFVAVLLSSSVFADSFDKVKQYDESTFSDIPTTEWYATEVKSAYELGFMNGVGGGLFSPDGNVTVSEAVTVAARIHSAYNKTEIPNADGEWYQMYVNYALNNGIIDKNTFDSYDRNVKRREMAVVLANSVPSEWLSEVNAVDCIPDINNNADCLDTILKLYRSGVVMGSDSYGTFYPENDIIRSEAAAIINRVALPENRLRKTLAKRPDPIAPLYFIDDSGSMNTSLYGQYGWEFDRRGVQPGTVPERVFVLDTSTDERTAMLRTFDMQSTGKLTMETIVTPSVADNGFCMILSLDEKSNAMEFVTKNGNVHANQNGTLTDTGVKLSSGTTVKTVTDLDAKTNTLIIDGNFIGTYAFADNRCNAVNTLAFSGTKEGTAVVEISKTKLYTGYAVNEIFLADKERSCLPYDFTLDGDLNAKIVRNNSNSYDFYSAELYADTASVGCVSKSFDKITRKVCFEMKYFMPSGNAGLTFALTNAGNEIVNIHTNPGDGCYYSADNALLRKINPKVWQTVRIEANTDTGVVTYKINGRTCGVGSFYADGFDGIKITVAAADKASLLIDDIAVYNLFDEQPDYVPVPVPTESDKAIVGIEVCDIWRNGFQHGWDYTSAFDELYTYLGMYDEGSPEVADWETKWLTEHGVDFKLVCWYSGTSTEPVKTPRNSFGINAHLNSKYSDMIKYAIMWENTSNLPQTSEQFRNNIVEYWKEYYLSDRDRYFSIDNKALIAVYTPSKLLDIFGTTANVKAELDYLRQTCVELGYDGAIILTTGSTANTNIAEMGFDGIYAYNWGQNAFNPEYQKTAIQNQSDSATSVGITSVPTVGVGFCNMFLGQGNSRSPLITADDLQSLLVWTNEEFLAKRAGDSWQNNMVILSNWNEFGEGHYILPTNRIGFTFLDAIRNAFSSASSEHSDIRPSDDTKKRYNALYDQQRKRIRRYELESGDEDMDLSTLTTTLSYDFTKADTEHIFKVSHGTTAEYTASSLKGVSAGADFAIITTKDLNIPADSADYFKIVYKATSSTVETKAQLYFLTETDKGWNEKKCVEFSVTADGVEREYLVNMTSCPAWSGKITSFRIDPIARGDCEWEINLVEFLDAPSGYEIYVNAEDYPTPTAFKPIYENGVLAVAIDPYAADFYTKLGIFYRWNYANGKFTLYGAGDSYITYTMGSKTAETSSGVKTLKIEPKLIDGIPLVEIDTMAEALGLNLTKKDNKYFLSNHYLAKSDGTIQDNIEWHFSIDGYLDSFTVSCAEFVGHKNGVAAFKSTSNGKRHDPTFNSPSISYPAVKYEKIIVGMSYDISEKAGANTTGISSSMFFAQKGGSINGNDVVVVNTEGLSSNGKIIEIEFDMTQNDNYVGTIEKLRFDPFEAEGEFAIDYIKVVLTNPDGVVRLKPRATEAVLDAGKALPDGIKYSAENATVTLSDDPENSDAKVFAVKSTQKQRAWSYFNISMYFVPGKTYDISFKVYGLPNAGGDSYEKVTIGGNFIYGSDGETVSNHTAKAGSVFVPCENGWVEVKSRFTVDESYVPSTKDCYQIWGDPVNNMGVGFLVKDIKITIAD